MRILIYGCSTEAVAIGEKLMKMSADVVFSDSDCSKWGKSISRIYEMNVLQPEKVKSEDYSFCVAGSEKFNDEITRILHNMGFEAGKIVPYGFIKYQKYMWQRINMITAWKQAIENDGIEILKNWFANGNDMVCLLRVDDHMAQNLIIYFLYPYKSCTLVEITNVLNGRTKRQEIQCIDKIEWKLFTDKNEIIRISIKDAPSEIPWIGFETHKQPICKKIKELKLSAISEKFYNNIMDFYYHDEDYLALSGSRQGGTIIDLGANYGQSMYAFYRLTASKIISVEASPDLADTLRCFKEIIDTDDRIRIINMGISDVKSEMVWYEPEGGRASGSFDREFIYNMKITVPIEKKVLPCITFDEMFPEIEDVWFVKIDVEGMEKRAISGGMKFIERNYPILLIEENQYEPEIINMLSEWYELKFYDFVQHAFTNHKVRGINYWLFPKTEYRSAYVMSFIKMYENTYE